MPLCMKQCTQACVCNFRLILFRCLRRQPCHFPHWVVLAALVTAAIPLADHRRLHSKHIGAIPQLAKGHCHGVKESLLFLSWG